MPFTFLFVLLALLILVIIFVAMYMWKGLKSALIVTGITAIVLAGVLLAAIGVIVSSMPN
ncbi:MAG: hypothetical protein PVJ21_03315 [Anaerolineales bacterium]|jgi:hypothetical protein